jgi:hypothetical protein
MVNVMVATAADDTSVFEWPVPVQYPLELDVARSVLGYRSSMLA